MLPDKPEAEVQKEQGERPSFDEAVESLRVREFPPYAEAFFGQENMRGFRAILEEKGVIELDALRIAEDLTEEEFCAYVQILPEYNETRVKFMDLSASIVDEISEKLGRYFEKGEKIESRSVPKKGTATIARKGIITIYSAISELMASQKIYIPNGFSAARLEEFETTLYVAITKAMLDYVDRVDKYSATLSRVLKYLNELFLKDNGSFFPGMGFISMQYCLGESMNREFINEWRTFLSFPEPVAEEELFLENSHYFEEIKRLAETRTIEPLYGEKDGVKVLFEGNVSEDVWGRMAALTTVEIVVDPSLPVQEILYTRASKGGYTRQVPYSAGAVFFDVDSATGKLTFPDTNFPLEKIMEGQAYERLRSLIFKTLHAYLSEKEEDVTFPDIREVPKAVGAIQEERRQEVEEVVPEFVNPYPYVPYDPYDPVLGGAGEEEEALDSEGEEEAFSGGDKAGSLKTRKVLKTLKKILGKKVRQQGSHVMFRAKDGVPKPIGTGHNEIGRVMLGICLKQYGITPEEFMESL